MPRAHWVFLPNKLKLEFPRAVILRHTPQEKVECPVVQMAFITASPSSIARASAAFASFIAFIMSRASALTRSCAEDIVSSKVSRVAESRALSVTASDGEDNSLQLRGFYSFRCLLLPRRILRADTL